MTSRHAIAAALLLLAAWLAPACPGDAPTPPEQAYAGELHTWTRVPSRDVFFDEMVDPGVTPLQVKFTLSGFSDGGGQDWLLDPRFYELHDEWYWFRLLNGVPIDDFPVEPIEGESYDTVADVYTAYRNAPVRPLDLKLFGERLVSNVFYDAALGRGQWYGERFFGIGSILYYPPQQGRPLPEELWLFELEYIDKVSEDEIAAFFRRLEAIVPAEIAPKLRWLARGSASQEALVASIRAGDGPFADRVATYDDLVVPGQFEAYNTGITAGRIKRFPKGTLGGASAGPEDIVVLEEVPDYLPPVAGILTGVPQTPLAHLNLLAKARGTPNAYLGGAVQDQEIEDLAYLSTYVIMKVTPDELIWKGISQAAYQGYAKKLGRGGFTIPQIDIDAAPYTVDLTEGGLEDVAGLVPLTGGKSAGFLALRSIDGVETPYAPFAITIRAYNQHLKSFVPVIQSVLAATSFTTDKRARFLVLEGVEDYLKEHAGDDAALTFLDTWLEEHPDSTQIGSVVTAGGLKRLIRNKPIAAATLDTITTALAERYAALDVTQGLRFRSSSTAEDVPGFNGAGLYDSNTGFLDPTAQPDEDEHDQTVEWALKKTWASYWSFEAFEERRLAGIDHLSGNMGVLVHPRFDDPKELANGVVTLSLRTGDAGPEVAEMVLNVQDGAISVTNPEAGSAVLPEVDRVTGTAPGQGVIERLQASTEVPAGSWVLGEAELLSVHADATRLAIDWLATSNAELALAQRSSTVVLDFELKKMRADWPAWASGTGPVGGTDRLVFKQVRVLDNPIVVAPATATEPIPRDVLSIVASVVRWTCVGPNVSVGALQVFTDPSRAGLIGYADEPLTAWVQVIFDEPVPGFPDLALEGYRPNHTQLSLVETSGAGEPWSLAFEVPGWLEEQWGLQRFEVDASGAWTMRRGDAVASGEGLTCQMQEVEQGPSAYLEALLAAP